MTATMIEEDIAHLDFTITDTDPARASHIVFVPPELNMTATAYVLAARIEGFPVVALCGYTWVPHRDPQAFPVCQECLEIYHQPGENREDRDRLPDA